MTSYIKSFLGFQNEAESEKNKNDESFNSEVNKIISNKINANNVSGKRFIDALDLCYFSEDQKKLELELDLSFGHLKGENDLDYKLAFGHLITPIDLMQKNNQMQKNSKEKCDKEEDNDKEEIVLKNSKENKKEYPDFDNYNWNDTVIV